MRLLKNKIRLKHEDNTEEYQDSPEIFPKKRENSTSSLPETSTVDTDLGVCEVILKARKPRIKPPCPEGDSKNIIKNYGKALCSFVSSKLAMPYIESVIAQKDYHFVKVSMLMQHFKVQKEKINSIESLRKLLIPNEDDTEEMKAYKDIFREVSIIFLKYFSVNWIYGGKLMHKRAHLKFRFKMLRRIQKPEQFTYLKTTVKQREKV